MIGRILGHYRLQEKVGAGGMGEVYRARDQRLERDVALKILPAGTLTDEAARQRFRREALALSKLNHPNIAVVHDFDTESGVDFLVMEFLSGATLAEKLRAGPLPEKETVGLGQQIAAALEEAHEQGVIHRDLKPSNVMVTPKGQAKVLDFGLAKVFLPGAGATTESLTESLAAVGTLPYMAPEQLRGGVADTRTDIWALGCVLYEMATGGRPFEARLATALAADIQHQPPRPPRQLNPALTQRLEEAILKCLEKEPENRYQSAKELLVDLRRAAQPAAAPAAAPRHGLSRRAAMASGGVAALVLLGILVSLNVGGLRDRLLGTGGRRRIASLVALPSKVLAADEDSFLTDAIPNTISTHLAQVQGLEVKVPPARIELERFKGDLGKIADAYRVDAFVRSTVSAQADQLLLNVQLVELPGRRLRWSREYEGARHEYVALVRRAAEDLRQELRPAALPVAAGAGVSAISGAELAYQRGLYNSNRFNNLHRPDDFEQALSGFQQALELDPQLADAAAEAAWLFWFKLEAGDPPQQVIPQMDVWARRALSIDPGNGRAWALLTHLEAGQGQASLRKLLVSALRAVNSAPRFPRSHISFAMSQNSCRLNLEATRQAARLDPLYLYAPTLSGWCLAALNRTEEALAEVHKALAIEPDMPFALSTKSFVLMRGGRLEEASSLLEQLEPMAAEGRFNPGWFATQRDLGLVLHGEPREAEAALQRLVRVASGETPILYNGPFVGMAMHTLASQGRVEAARQLLLAYYRSGEVPPYDDIRLDPDMQWVLRDPELAEIVQRSRAEFEEKVSVLEEARRRGELPAYLERPLADLVKQLGMPPG